jgi:hypothetical protein
MNDPIEFELEHPWEGNWWVLEEDPLNPAKHTNTPNQPGWWCNLNLIGIEANTALEVISTKEGLTILEWAEEPTLVADLPDSQQKPNSWAGPFLKVERLPQKKHPQLEN